MPGGALREGVSKGALEVFAIPKLLRRLFFHHRQTLNNLSRVAWDCVKRFMRDALGGDSTFRPLRGLDEGAHHYLLPLRAKVVAAQIPC